MEDVEAAGDAAAYVSADVDADTTRRTADSLPPPKYVSPPPPPPPPPRGPPRAVDASGAPADGTDLANTRQADADEMSRKRLLMKISGNVEADWRSERAGG
jgi:hypothetical protein